MRGNWLKPALNLAGWVAALLLIAYFWQRLSRQDADWEGIFASLNWGQFTLATALLLVGHLLRSQLGYVSHRYLKFPLTRWQSYRFFYLAQLAKYIPGGVWTFATGVVAYKRNGMPLIIASAVTTWELLALLFTSLVISLLGVGLYDDPTWTPLIVIGALGFIVTIVLLLLPFPWRVLTRLHLRPAQKMLDILSELGARRYGLLARLSILALAGWLLTGAGFYALVLAFNLEQSIQIGYATAAYALAWTVGFLVIFAPTGLGPREAILTALLTPACGPAAAFSIALMARLWWTIADALHISIALLVPALWRNHPAVSEKRHVQQP